mgnify:CR=1 FL=1
MLISKPRAALIGVLSLAAILGFIPKGSAHQPQPAKPAKQALAIAQPLPLPTNPDPWAGISDQERLRGDAEIPREGE